MSTIAHLTLAQYDRMITAGVFDQRRASAGSNSSTERFGK